MNSPKESGEPVSRDEGRREIKPVHGLPNLNPEFPPPTQAGWMVLIASAFAAVISTFISLDYVYPYFDVSEVGVVVGILFIAAVSLICGLIGRSIAKKRGLVLFAHQQPETPAEALASSVKRRFIGAVVGAVMMFVVGLFFNTGTIAANSEIAAFTALGAIVGFSLGGRLGLIAK